MRGPRSSCKLLPISFSGRAHSAQENDVKSRSSMHSRLDRHKKTSGCVRQPDEFELLN